MAETIATLIVGIMLGCYEYKQQKRNKLLESKITTTEKHLTKQLLMLSPHHSNLYLYEGSNPTYRNVQILASSDIESKISSDDKYSNTSEHQ